MGENKRETKRGPQRYEIMARSGIGRSPIADRPRKGHRLRGGLLCGSLQLQCRCDKKGVVLILGLSDTSSVLHEVEPIL